MNPHFLVTLLLLTFSGSEKTDCPKYKNGKFYTYSPITKHKIIVERHDNIQIEIDTETGETSTNKIEWLSECEYKIIAMTNSKPSKDGVDSFFAITPIKVAITTTGKDYYVFQIRVDSAQKHVEYSDTLKVLKE